MAWTANAAGFRFVAVEKNAGGTEGGGTRLFPQFNMPDPLGAQGDFSHICGIVDMSANDYIEAFVYQNSGGNLDALTTGSGWECYLSLYYIGE
jgi:hypothetical protein